MSRYVSLCLDMSQRPPIKRYSALNIVLHLNGTMNSVEKLMLNYYKYGTINPGLFKRLRTSLFGNNLFLSSSREDFWTAIYSYQKASKEDLVNKGFGQNVTVYAVISTISRVAAQAPWAVYKVKNVTAYNRLKAIQQQPYSAKQQMALKLTKEEALEPYQSHYLNAVFQHPNEQQSGAEYMENLLGFKLLTGDSYELANMSETGKKIGELWVLPSQNIKILTDQYGEFPMRERGYKMFFGSREITYDAETVCHSKYWSPYYHGDGSHLYGFSPLDAAFLNVLQDNSAREAAVELLKNRGPRGIFSIESDKLRDYDHFKEIKGNLVEDFNQRGKEFKDAVMPVFGRGQWHNVGLSAKDLAIIDICKLNKDDICNAYGVSTILLNNHDASTDNNYQHARKELITRAVLPLLGTIRDARNRKLKSDWNSGGEKIVCDFDPTIFTELYDDVWNMAKDMRAVGAYTDNEIRIQTNFEQLNAPYANEIWKKTNDIPVSLIGKDTLTSNSRGNEQGAN